jgi:trans-aconitate methyltransferase
MATCDFDGEKYNKASGQQKQWGNRIIAELGLKGHESVLDLGCGDGVLTEQLACRVPDGRVIGIDASPGMLETARKIQRKNLTFKLMDIADMDFEDGFDLVFSNTALHWVKDHHRLWRNVHRSLRPNGVARFHFAGDGNCSHLIETVRSVMQEPSFRPYFERFEWPWYMPRVDEYAVIVREGGFPDARVWGENADRSFRDVDEMTRWIDQPSLVPFLKHVDAKDRQLFRNTVVERMIQATRRADGRCFETFRRIHVTAQKR